MGTKRFRKSCLFSLKVLVTAAITTSAVWGETVRIVGDVFEPYNSDPVSGRSGFVVDIAQRIFEQQGYKVEYKLRPWSRALKETKMGRFDMLAGALESVAQESGLKISNEAVGHISVEFFTRSDNDWKYTGPESLDLVKIGTIKDYGYTDPGFLTYVSENRKNNVFEYAGTGEKALSGNLSKVVKGRIDVTLDDAYVSRYVMKKMSLEGQLKPAGRLGTETPLYMVFAPNGKHTAKYMEIFDQGIRQLRQSGELKQILARYGMEDWQ